MPRHQQTFRRGNQGRRTGVRWGLSLAPATGCAGTVLWDDDFESADALSVDYDASLAGSMSKVSGIGPDGSQALRATSQYDELTRDLGSAQYEGCASFDSKTTITDGLLYILEVRYQFGWWISLYRNDDTIGENYAELYYRVENPSTGNMTEVEWDKVNAGGALNFWTPNDWSHVQLEWKFATPDGGASSAPWLLDDGYIRLKKNGGIVYEQTGIRLWGQPSGGNYQKYDTVVIAPQGDMDNLRIRDTA